MRLTAELITHSLSYTNTLKERELDLRGHKIPTIENLGSAKDQECIDFTDNDIQILGGFPLSTRLQTLLLARNRIASIQQNLHRVLPNLRTLVLTENQVSELSDLDPLQGFTKLTHVSFVGNPVVSKENYRYYILWRCPQIRFLDYQKVKDAEREHAIKLFGTLDAPNELARSIMATGSKRAGGAGVAPGMNGTKKVTKMKLSDKEKLRYEKLVKGANSLSEVQQLEKMLAEGRLPPGVADNEAMDET